MCKQCMVFVYALKPSVFGVRLTIPARDMEFDGGLGGSTSRQDASIECHVGGSIRPSSGCNGVHFA